MKTVGIVAEYNPFHFGHEYHIKKTREQIGEECAVVCAMSGDFVQRGEAAIYSKFARAEAAARSGADLCCGAASAVGALVGGGVRARRGRSAGRCGRGVPELWQRGGRRCAAARARGYPRRARDERQDKRASRLRRDALLRRRASARSPRRGGGTRQRFWSSRTISSPWNTSRQYRRSRSI